MEHEDVNFEKLVGMEKQLIKTDKLGANGAPIYQLVELSEAEKQENQSKLARVLELEDETYFSYSTAGYGVLVASCVALSILLALNFEQRSGNSEVVHQPVDMRPADVYFGAWDLVNSRLRVAGAVISLVASLILGKMLFFTCSLTKPRNYWVLTLLMIGTILVMSAFSIDANDYVSARVYPACLETPQATNFMCKQGRFLATLCVECILGCGGFIFSVLLFILTWTGDLSPLNLYRREKLGLAAEEAGAHEQKNEYQQFLARKAREEAAKNAKEVKDVEAATKAEAKPADPQAQAEQYKKWYGPENWSELHKGILPVLRVSIVLLVCLSIAVVALSGSQFMQHTGFHTTLRHAEVNPQRNYVKGTPVDVYDISFGSAFYYGGWPSINFELRTSSTVGGLLLQVFIVSWRKGTKGFYRNSGIITVMFTVVLTVTLAYDLIAADRNVSKGCPGNGKHMRCSYHRFIATIVFDFFSVLLTLLYTVFSVLWRIRELDQEYLALGGRGEEHAGWYQEMEQRSKDIKNWENEQEAISAHATQVPDEQDVPVPVAQKSKSGLSKK